MYNLYAVGKLCTSTVYQSGFTFITKQNGASKLAITSKNLTVSNHDNRTFNYEHSNNIDDLLNASLQYMVAHSSSLRSYIASRSTGGRSPLPENTNHDRERTGQRMFEASRTIHPNLLRNRMSITTEFDGIQEESFAPSIRNAFQPFGGDRTGNGSDMRFEESSNINFENKW